MPVTLAPLFGKFQGVANHVQPLEMCLRLLNTRQFSQKRSPIILQPITPHDVCDLFKLKIVDPPVCWAPVSHPQAEELSGAISLSRDVEAKISDKQIVASQPVWKALEVYANWNLFLLKQKTQFFWLA